MAATASPRKPPLIAWSAKAASTTGKAGQSAMVSAAAAIHKRTKDDSGPLGTDGVEQFAGRPTSPAADRIKPIFCWVQFWLAR
jgi:hypothetical protein